MKKLIAIVLALVMVFSLVACRDTNTEKDPTNATTSSQQDEQGEPNPTKPEDNATEPDATEPEGTVPEDTEPEQTEPSVDAEQIDGRQAMWEKVFSEGTFKISAESLEMVLEDMLTISLLTDDSGKAYMSVSGTVEGKGTIGTAMYRYDDDTAYFHSFGDADGQTVDQWYLCEIKSEEDNSTLDNTLNDSADTSELLGHMNAIEKIVYVESVGDIDYVELYCAPSVEGSWTITYDATVSFEKDGQVGEFRYTMCTSDEGYGTSSSWEWNKEVEGVELFEWKFDKDAMTLTNGDQVLKCTLVEDHYKAPVEDPFVVMRVAVNSKTYEIKEMSVTEDGSTVSIKFIDCENVEEVVRLPESVEETMAIDDAAMQFAMTMFSLIMSQADMG